MLKANRQIAVTRVKVLLAKLINVSAIAWAIKPAVRGTLLSNLETRNPEIGNPIIEAIGIENNRVPNSASLNPKEDFIVGILDAQVEKQTPAKKKNTLKKYLFLLFESMYQLPFFPSALHGLSL
jgi:hypothetical protein